MDCYFESSPRLLRLVREPKIPAWAGPRTLAVVSSYSGNTAETLEMYRQAREKGCRIIAVTSGGRLHELAEENGDLEASLPKAMQPRHAIGYMIGYTMAAIRAAGAPDLSGEIRSFIPSLRRYRDENTLPEGCVARRIATLLEGHVPVVLSDQYNRSAAFRWKTQFNENSKMVAFCDSVPGFIACGAQSWISEGRDNYTLLVLRNHRTAEMDEVVGKLSGSGNHLVIDLGGSSEMEGLFRAIILGDYISMYIAQSRGIDPAEVRPVMQMKAKLSQRWKPLRYDIIELRGEHGRSSLGHSRVPRFRIDAVLRLRPRGSQQHPAVLVQEF